MAGISNETRFDTLDEKEINEIGSNDVAPIDVPGQQWASVIFVGPKCKDTSNYFAMSILGCFSTQDECAKHSERLRKSGFVAYDIWTVKTNKFLLVPPNPDRETVIDKKYLNESSELQNLMQQHKDAAMRAQDEVKERTLATKDTQDKRRERKMKFLHGKQSASAENNMNDEIKDVGVKIGKPIHGPRLDNAAGKPKVVYELEPEI